MVNTDVLEPCQIFQIELFEKIVNSSQPQLLLGKPPFKMVDGVLGTLLVKPKTMQIHGYEYRGREKLLWISVVHHTRYKTNNYSKGFSSISIYLLTKAQ